MVCDRCKAAVSQALVATKIPFEKVNLGNVEIKKKPSATQLRDLEHELARKGFELIQDKTSRIVSQIKDAAIEFVHRDQSAARPRFSDYLSGKLNKNYSDLSNVFSSVEGTTIEQFVILQKIERVKELLVYDEKSMQEIADSLGYSSVPHLSNQFKKVTGLSPSHFKKVGLNRRKALDRI
jgi:AraC family transcriptional regulator